MGLITPKRALIAAAVLVLLVVARLWLLNAEPSPEPAPRPTATVPVGPTQEPSPTASASPVRATQATFSQTAAKYLAAVHTYTWKTSLVVWERNVTRHIDVSQDPNGFLTSAVTPATMTACAATRCSQTATVVVVPGSTQSIDVFEATFRVSVRSTDNGRVSARTSVWHVAGDRNTGKVIWAEDTGSNAVYED